MSHNKLPIITVGDYSIPVDIANTQEGQRIAVVGKKANQRLTFRPISGFLFQLGSFEKSKKPNLISNEIQSGFSTRKPKSCL